MGRILARFERPVTDEQARRLTELVDDGTIGHDLPEWEREYIKEYIKDMLQMLTADNLRKQMERQRRAERRMRERFGRPGLGSDFEVVVIDECKDDDATLG